MEPKLENLSSNGANILRGDSFRGTILGEMELNCHKATVVLN
jgi:hypothetical protein